jgi:putative ABC transport system substrate-binding protein
VITRREFCIAGGAGLSLLAAPLASPAQQQRKVWRVGFLSTRSRPVFLDADFYGGFPRGMRELGYVEGKNLVIEWRFANGNPENLSGLAAELARLKMDVIVTAGTATGAAQKATATIPIVMGAVGDPVGNGYVVSLARPGGNITGLSNLAADLRPKHLEMLLGVMPKLARVAVLVNAGRPDKPRTLEILQAAGQKTNVQILPVEVRTPEEIENAFSVMARERAGAIIVTLDPFFVQQRRQIAELAAKHRLPSIAAYREYVEAGGLMSYGQNQAESYRRAAVYVDKILKGAKPGDLPVEQPTILELFINGRTAKALGITIPQSILVRADRVIE